MLLHGVPLIAAATPGVEHTALVRVHPVNALPAEYNGWLASLIVALLASFACSPWRRTPSRAQSVAFAPQPPRPRRWHGGSFSSAVSRVRVPLLDCAPGQVEHPFRPASAFAN
jgi:hypothetical protein